MRILLIDEAQDQLNNYIPIIEKQYIVDVAYNAEDGTYMSETTEYDVIVMNTTSEFNFSHQFCKNTRKAKIETPILLLADRENIEARITALEHGADVCMYKPIHPLELSAQIRALVRRHNQSIVNTDVIYKDLKIDLLNRSIFYLGRKIDIRRKEFDILEYLLIHKSRVISKEVLLEHVWEEGLLVRSNTLEVHIRNIRKKIFDISGIDIIETRKGFGYKLAD